MQLILKKILLLLKMDTVPSPVIEYEIKELDIDGVNKVRMFVSNNINWFCALDIANCLGIRSGSSSITRYLDDVSKINIIIDSKELMFITENKARIVIEKSRSKNSGPMKHLLYKFIIGESVPKIKPPSKKPKIPKETPTSPPPKKKKKVRFQDDSPDIKVAVPLIKQQQPPPLILPPSNLYIPDSIANNPELVKYTIDKQVEMKKIEMDTELLKSQSKINAQLHRDIITNKLRFMDHAEFFIKQSMFDRSAPETIAFVNAHAKASLNFLQENFNTNVSYPPAQLLPPPQVPNDIKMLSDGVKEQYLKTKNTDMIKQHLSLI